MCEAQEARQGSRSRNPRRRSAGQLAPGGARGGQLLGSPGAASSGPGGGGPGGYSRVRSYFHTPFASPRVRRSAPPPRPPPPPPAPGRRPFFTTSQRPAPAVIAAMVPTRPPRSATSPGFPAGVHAPRSATSLCRASRRVTPPQGILGVVVFRFCQVIASERWGCGWGRASGLLRRNQLPKVLRRRLLRLGNCHGAPTVWGSLQQVTC